MGTAAPQTGTGKQALYDQAKKEIEAVIVDEPNTLARLATTLCILDEKFDYFFWTGFYMVDSAKPDELVVGPYRGTLGCLRIPFGADDVRGVCGKAAATRQTVVVEDVHKFEGHIACDSRSQSEIVVPVFSPDGSLYAVLDVDSTELGSFCEVDRENLESIVSQLVT